VWRVREVAAFGAMRVRAALLALPSRDEDEVRDAI
jgi:hypothetical protein